MKKLPMIKSMRNIPTPISSKLFSIPRTYNSSVNFLELYVLSKEKQRMEQELQMLEDKRDILLKKVTLIESKMAEYRAKAEEAENRYNAMPLTQISFQGEANVPYKEILLDY